MLITDDGPTLRDCVELVDMLAEYFLSPGISVLNYALDLLVNLRSDALGIIPDVVEVLAEEDLVALIAESDGAELVAHAVFRDHAAGYLGRSLDIV